jgi:hypothetical protein
VVATTNHGSAREAPHTEITGAGQPVPGCAGHGEGMGAPGLRRPWLYDPSLGGVLVRAHRQPAAGAARAVVSDAVWTDVLGLLRWAEATLTCPADLTSGTAWRTAAGAAALLRRLPGLCDELGLAWPGAHAGSEPVGGSAAARLRTAVDRLALLLCSPEVDAADRRGGAVAELARCVDETGAAAIAVLAEGTDWTVRG